MKVLIHKTSTVDREAAPGLTGLMAITVPAYKLKPKDQDETEYCHQVAMRLGLQDYAVIDNDQVPTDRKYRNAWTAVGSAIKTDMPAAREIYMTGLRKKRSEILAKTDGPMARAKEQDDATTEDALKIMRAKLRNLPARVDTAVTAAKTTAALDKIATPELKSGESIR